MLRIPTNFGFIPQTFVRVRISGHGLSSGKRGKGQMGHCQLPALQKPGGGRGVPGAPAEGHGGVGWTSDQDLPSMHCHWIRSVHVVQN